MAGENDQGTTGDETGTGTQESGTEQSGAFQQQDEESTGTEATSGAFGNPDATGEGDAGQGDGEGSESGSGSEQEGTQGAPEQYADFELPEGMVANDAMMATFQEKAKAAGLTQEQAQSQLNTLAEWKAIYDQQAVDFYSEQMEAWTKSSREEGLFRGSFLKEAEHGLALLDPSGDLGPFLHQMGLDKHPAVIKAFSEYGRARMEDDVVDGGSRASDDRPPEKVMYGGDKK